jgi:hypothetical protein
MNARTSESRGETREKEKESKEVKQQQHKNEIK